MKETDKQLIINLFKKIKSISLQTPNKDPEAIKLINFLLQNHNDAVYYMVQTLLVQDIILEELNDKIKKLQNQEKQFSMKNTSFLSDDIKQKVRDLPIEKNISNDHSKSLYTKQVTPYNTNHTYHRDNTPGTGGGISSFLGNAVQTAVGVAGGMVAGNMLANFFNNHDKNSNDLNHSNDSEINNDHHINAPINNFFQIDDSDYSHDDHGGTSDLDDMYDLEEDL